MDTFSIDYLWLKDHSLQCAYFNPIMKKRFIKTMNFEELLRLNFSIVNFLVR